MSSISDVFVEVLSGFNEIHANEVANATKAKVEWEVNSKLYDELKLDNANYDLNEGFWGETFLYAKKGNVRIEVQPEYIEDGAYYLEYDIYTRKPPINEYTVKYWVRVLVDGDVVIDEDYGFDTMWSKLEEFKEDNNV